MRMFSESERNSDWYQQAGPTVLTIQEVLLTYACCPHRRGHFFDFPYIKKCHLDPRLTEQMGALAQQGSRLLCGFTACF